MHVYANQAETTIDTVYDSLAEEGTPLELLFFFSYFLIQGCLSTSDNGNLSSGSLRSS
jgi:hypothetical protein